MIRTFTLLFILLCAILIFTSAVALESNKQTTPTDNASSGWINLDKASEILKQPGKKVILALASEKIKNDEKQPDENSESNAQIRRQGGISFSVVSTDIPDKYYSDIYIIGPTGEKVKILEKGVSVEKSSCQIPGGGIVCISANDYKKALKYQNYNPAYYFSEGGLTPLMLSNKGISKATNVEYPSKVKWFGKNGFTAELDYEKRDSDEPVTEKQYKIRAVKVFDCYGQLRKIIDLSKQIPFYKERCSYGFHPDGWIVYTEKEYCIVSYDQPIKVEKMPFEPFESANYLDNFFDWNGYLPGNWYISFQRPLVISPKIQVFFTYYPFNAVIPQFNNSEVQSQFHGLVAKREGDSSFTALMQANFPKLIGFTSDYSHAYFYEKSSDFVDMDLNTGEYITKNYKISFDFFKDQKFEDSINRDETFVDNVSKNLMILRNGVVWKLTETGPIEMVKEDSPITAYYTIY